MRVFAVQVITDDLHPDVECWQGWTGWHGSVTGVSNTIDGKVKAGRDGRHSLSRDPALRFRTDGSDAMSSPFFLFDDRIRPLADLSVDST